MKRRVLLAILGLMVALGVPRPARAMGVAVGDAIGYSVNGKFYLCTVCSIIKMGNGNYAFTAVYEAFNLGGTFTVSGVP